MSWIAAAVSIGGALIGASATSHASSNAADQAAQAQEQATAEQKRQFDLVNTQSAPQRQAGYNALSDLSSGFNQADPTGGQATPSGSVAPGYFAHQFDANDLKTNLAPNYDFMLKQGQGAATNALNVTGGLGGNFAQGLNQFTQDYAGNAYQNAFNNYTANQQNIFNRLSTVAGYGTTANSTVAGSANAITPGIAGSIAGAGAAQAAGTIGSASNLSTGLQNAASWYTATKMANPGGVDTSGNTFGGGSTGYVPDISGVDWSK